MRYFVKDNSNEHGKSSQGNLLDGVYQKRLAYSLLQHEYGKARENSSWRTKTRSNGVMGCCSDHFTPILQHSGTPSFQGFFSVTPLSWMMAPVNLFESCAVHMGVNLRGRDVRMT